MQQYNHNALELLNCSRKTAHVLIPKRLFLMSVTYVKYLASIYLIEVKVMTVISEYLYLCCQIIYFYCSLNFIRFLEKALLSWINFTSLFGDLESFFLDATLCCTKTSSSW